MPGLIDWIRHPHDILDDIYDGEKEHYSNKIQDFFVNKIKDPNQETKIPIIRSDLVPPQIYNETFVKLYCMVQDILNPSFYYEVCEINNKDYSRTMCGKYRNTINAFKFYKDKIQTDLTSLPDFSALSINELSQDNKLSELNNYVGVSISGITKWWIDEYCHNTISDDNEDHNINEPNIFWDIKIYDKSQGASYIKLNDIIKVYGILSWDVNKNYEVHVIHYEIVDIPPTKDVLHQIANLQILSFDAESTKMAETYNIFVRTIHEAFLAFEIDDRLLANYLSLMLLAREGPLPSAGPESKTAVTFLPNTSFHYLAIIHPHHPTRYSVVAKIIDALAQILLPLASNLRLDAGTLNAGPLYPIKSYDEGNDEVIGKLGNSPHRTQKSTIPPNPLQLPPHTFITLDASGTLHSTDLNVTGHKNVDVICHLLKTRQLTYDFKYYPLHMDTRDKIILVTSPMTPTSPFFGVNPTLPLKLQPPGHVTDETAQNLGLRLESIIGPEKLTMFRSYVSYVNSITSGMGKILEPSQHSTGQLLESDGEDIINDFVSIRSRNVLDMSGDDMQQNLTLARYLSICKGESLTFANWQEIKVWECERKQRISLAIIDNE